MASIEINYGDPESDIVISDSKDNKKKHDEPKPLIDIRDLPQTDLQIVEITQIEEEKTPPPMPSDEQTKQWRKEIEEKAQRNN